MIPQRVKTAIEDLYHAECRSRSHTPCGDFFAACSSCVTQIRGRLLLSTSLTSVPWQPSRNSLASKVDDEACSTLASASASAYALRTLSTATVPEHPPPPPPSLLMI